MIDPAQLSVAVGAVNVSTLHSAATSARVATSATGAVVSNTVIVCVYVLALPLMSVAVQTLVITELFPISDTAVSVEVTATVPPQLSVAVALPNVVAEVSVSHCTVTLAGDVVNIGPVTSSIITF